MDIEFIGIVGTGTIGSSWAAFYASKGYVVKMYDADPHGCRKGLQQAMSHVELLRSHGFLSEAEENRAIANLHAVERLSEAVGDVQLVAVCAGPGLRWAIMGQHLIYHLGGGEGGMDNFIDHLGPAIESWWKTMATWTELPAEARQTLVAGVQVQMGDRSMEQLGQWRDKKLIRLIKAVVDG